MVSKVARLDDWLQPTRERLEEWALVMRSVKVPALNNPGERDVMPSDELYSDAAMVIERCMCKLKRSNVQAYLVLFNYYYLRRSSVEISTRMNMGRNIVTQWRLVGETMIQTYWVAENETDNSLQIAS